MGRRNGSRKTYNWRKEAEKEEIYNARMDKERNKHPQNNSYTPAKKKPATITPRGENQRNYVKCLEDSTKFVTFGIGPAGSGKTLLATQCAIKQLQAGIVEKIVITRPAVSVDEQHGFLPGTLQKKMEPWMLPILDVFNEHYTQKEIQAMINDNVLEIAPLAYMRGRTFKKSFIIADEMQNATPSQVKMILTRIGENSKICMTGDLAQHDRGFEENGLRDFLARLENSDSVDGLNIIRFSSTDIQRHPIITQILRLYKEE